MMTVPYRKPLPPGCFGLANASDHIVDAQYRRLNNIVDREGWKQANSAAYAHLSATICWLARVHGSRKIYELVSVAADQLITDSLVSVDDG
jgi:hypothetical protein